MEENFRFICEECNYMTHDKSNYNKHFKTNKHLNKLKGALTDENKIYKCKGCNKKFNNRTSLWRHKKKCFIDKEFEESDSEYNSLSDDDEYENMDEEYDDKEYDDNLECDFENNYESESDDEFEEEMKQGSAKGLQKIIKMLIKENSEFKDTIMMQQQQQNETNKIMMELVKSNTNPNPNPNSTMTSTTNGITNGNNNVNNLVINNSNTTNNNFNLNFFLNETCKDAMNIEEFMDSIEITIPDLKRLGKCGYVEALSNLLITHLRSIEYTRRPMHCSDVKRETIYIRDKHKWEKENEEKQRLNKLLLGVTRLNTIALQDIYQKKYPHCLTNHKSKEHKEYGEIAYNAFGGSKGDADKLNKYIIKNLIKEIKIEKYLPQII